ncbi:HNH endonuclease [Pseudomonas bubulae]|uniref:HNH endonuclease n=1 Tax=Pseudomonas bubulae TaxID=2316085 RepID=UPI00399FFD0C
MFNIIRTPTPPASLAKKTSYSEHDVWKALNEIFHGKCYICETKDPQSIQIEHFVSVSTNDTKKFDWNNLFFACSRCNNLKGNHFNDLIDCSDAGTDALRLIRHVIPPTPFSKSVTIEAQNNNPKTISTAKLISKVFNEDDTGNKSVASSSLRRRVHKKYKSLFLYMNIYDDDEELPENKADALKRIQILMSKTQEYSAFLRWAVLDSPYLLEKIEGYID